MIYQNSDIKLLNVYIYKYPNINLINYKMKYEFAKKMGEEVLKKINPYIIKGEIAGSIRRKKPDVHDIDLVILPKDNFMAMINIKNVIKHYGAIDWGGQKIIRVKGKGELEIDCYIATEKNFSTLLLIRTGSKEHNLKIAKECLKKGFRLKYNLGIVDGKGDVIADTEEKIFKILGLPFLKPEERD